MVRKCLVPSCPNNSSNCGKLFFNFPKKMERRAVWFKIIGKENVPKGVGYYFCCEDHFDLPTDAANWMKVQLLGEPVRLKSDVVPHKNLKKILQEMENQTIIKKEKPQENISPLSGRLGLDFGVSMSSTLKEEPGDYFENSNFDYEDFELTDQESFLEEKPLIKKRKVEYEDEVHPEMIVTQPDQSTITILPVTSNTTINSLQSIHNQATDEISLYIDLLVTKLRKFDRRNRLIICNKIDNLLFETELNSITESKISNDNPLANDVPTTSRSGKISMNLSYSPSHSEFSEHLQSD